MLLHRSILTKVCLLLAICIVKAQYEYGKEEEKKEVKEEEDERDYGKIFAQETAAALTAAVEEPTKAEPTDYTTEFENYFKPAHIFGESNNQDVKADPQKQKEQLQTHESQKERDYSSFFDEPEKKKKEPLQTHESQKERDYSSFYDEPQKKKNEPLQTHESQKERDYSSFYDEPQKKKNEPLQTHESQKERDYSYFYDEPQQKKKEPLQTHESKKERDYSAFYDEPLKKFFEESEKRQEELHKQQSNKEEDVVRPGPSYISHQVPAHFVYDDEGDKSPSASEDVEAKKNQPKSKAGANFEEGRVEKNDDDYKLPRPLTFEPFKINKPKVDYNTGKSSSTVSQTQHPEASEYYYRHAPAASTPYEKYSFQPVEDYEAENSKFFDSILSTVAPYNPSYKKNTEPKYESQSTEDSPSHLQGKGCRKVSSSSDKDDMNCFVCQNPKTNAKYTQCSYSAKKKPIDYYEGNAAKYSVPQKEDASSYRYKRFANNDEDDPYTYIRNRARKTSDGSHVPSDFGFNYEAEHYDESKPELTFSEQHSEEIKKNPENCKKVDRKGMTCTVCQDPKSGGNFEQCSYTSKPKEKKYAYVTEKKFDNDEPQESHVVSQSKAAESKEKEKSDGTSTKKNTELFEEYQGRVDQDKSPKKRNEEARQDYVAKPSEKKENEEDYEFHFKTTPSFPDYKGSSSENIDNKKRVDDFSEFDEYHFKYFPEFAKQESRQESVQESYEVPAPEATKQNVDTVLAEFTKKDRSNCKKAQKKGMTCYLCVDKNNIQNEECMYVQESKPETKHVAYHEVKATEKATEKATDKATENAKVPETEKNKPEESKQETKKETKEAAKQESKDEPAVAESRNNYFFMRVPAPVSGMEVAASEDAGTYVRYNPEEASKKKKKRSDKSKPKSELKPDASTYDAERIDDKADPTIKTPTEFVVGPGEGAFSDETKAVYNKELGIQLPKYMLEKSEFEKEFDAFSGSF